MLNDQGEKAVAVGFGISHGGSAYPEPVKATQPLLLDVRMPQLDGLEVLQALRAEGNAVAVVLLSTFSEAATALAGLRLGAYSYLLKDVEFAVLTETLHAAVKGDRTIHSALPRHFLPVDQANPQPELTLRELEVLRLMAGGHSNKQVARALHLQEGTVKNHVSSLLSKLERQDRLQAVLRALDLGLLGRWGTTCCSSLTYWYSVELSW
ncbi:response regulator transcription factor [Deinococcus sp. Arct2-2]|uniref:response regulator transcription factor n=1 Tax=Deinococcus sp. Arct2-2 TaxID=2568653 RepID=UPI003211DAB3